MLSELSFWCVGVPIGEESEQLFKTALNRNGTPVQAGLIGTTIKFGFFAERSKRISLGRTGGGRTNPILLAGQL
jgi:hypothetical protein